MPHLWVIQIPTVVPSQRGFVRVLRKFFVFALCFLCSLAPDKKLRWMAYANCPNTEGNILIVHRGDLKSGIAWILTGQKKVGLPMVQISNGK